MLLQGIKGSATNRPEKAFHYSIPKEAFKKASVVTILTLSLVIVSTYLLLILEPNLSFLEALFEMTSAFGTVGLSTCVTYNLSIGAKFLYMIMMFIGRLGPLTVISLWNFNKIQRFYYPDGNISVG